MLILCINFSISLSLFHIFNVTNLTLWARKSSFFWIFFFCLGALGLTLSRRERFLALFSCNPEHEGFGFEEAEDVRSFDPEVEGFGAEESFPFAGAGDGFEDLDPEGDGSEDLDPEGDGFADLDPEGDGSEDLDPEGDGFADLDPEGECPTVGNFTLILPR